MCGVDLLSSLPPVPLLSSRSCDQLKIIENVNKLIQNFLFLKEEVDAAVAELLKLKAEYKNLTGEDVAGGGKGKKDKKKEAASKNDKQDTKPSKKQEKAAQPAKVENGDVDSTGKKVTRYVNIRFILFDCIQVFPLTFSLP